MQSTTAVTGIPCPCPGTPHPDGDTVYLRDKLGLRAGATLQSLIIASRRQNARDDDAEPPPLTPMQTAEVNGNLIEQYVLLGVVGWTFVDGKGQKVPVHSDTIRSWLLDDFERATPVADAADDLYKDAVIGPLVRGASELSPDTTTDTSTSHIPTGTQSDPTQSRPFSTSTTPMDDTETTSLSLAGASS